MVATADSTLPNATAEIDDSGTRVIVDWGGGYNYFAKEAMKRVPSATFKPADRSETGKAYWYVQLRLDYMRELRAQWGDSLRLGRKLKKWGKEQVERERKLLKIQTSLWADLPVLQDGDKWHRKMFEALYIGPRGPKMTAAERREALNAPHGSFQTADVRFMADCPNPLNANQPGTGKTLETIACTFEAELEGPRLVVAQKSSLETVWLDHLEKWQPYPVILAMGDAAAKRRAIEQAQEWAEWGEPFWLVCNVETVRYNGIYQVNPITGKKLLKGVEWNFPEIAEIDWDVIVVDEFHKIGLNNPESLTSKAMFDLQATKKIDLSGTPMGGQPMKLWSVLHHLEPKEFSSKWGFANMWLDITPGERGLEIGDVRKDKQEAFGEMLSRYMVRRLKSEVLPWLPEKNDIELWVHMDGKQKEQYDEFAEMAEIRIEEEELSAAGILAEYTRLRQFANGVQKLIRKKVWDSIHQCHVEKVIPIPTEESCKLPEVMRILGELGVEPRGKGSGEGVLIFSQFTQVVNMVHGYLIKQQIRADKLTGETSDEDRKRVQEEFQNGYLDVLVMNTHAGGTSITLDRANTVIFLDETWNPDDQEQASDRAHRGSKTHQVNVYWIRTRETIEEYIYRVNQEKKETNFNILDARRQGLRAKV